MMRHARVSRFWLCAALSAFTILTSACSDTGGDDGGPAPGSGGTTGGAGAGTTGSAGTAGNTSTGGTGGQATAGTNGAAGRAGSSSMPVAGTPAGGSGGGAAGSAAGAGGSGGAAGGAAGAAGAAGSGDSAGSGGNGGSGSGGGATFTQVYSIIMMKCGGGPTGCHVTGSSGGLRMPNKAMAYTNLVGVDSEQCNGETRVVAGNPDDSLIVQAVEGEACVDRMPYGRAALSANEIMTIRSWIMAGALND